MAAKRVCALAIGGLDPGGGAGILADMRAFSACGVFGTAAATLVTVQSTRGLLGLKTLAPSLVVDQIDEVFVGQRVRAIKIGALGKPAIVRAIAQWIDQRIAALKPRIEIPIVLDTPMTATRVAGHSPRLLASRAASTMVEHLFPKTTVLTVNLSEAATFANRPVKTVADAEHAATLLLSMGPRMVIVKGGHLTGKRALDVVAIGKHVHFLDAPRLPQPRLHGAGCTFASLIAGKLAANHAGGPINSRQLLAAAKYAKKQHHLAISNATDVGGPLRVLPF